MVPFKRNVVLAGVLTGLVYALVAYLTFKKLATMPTIAFLGLVPLGLGAVPLLFEDLDQVKNYAFILLIPWLSLLGLFVLLFATLQEGALCFVVLGFPFFGLALVGTLIATIVRAIIIRRDKRKAVGAAMMLLPFLVVGLEQRYLVREEKVTVTSSVIVDAPAEQVFDRLAEVETIGDEEYDAGLWTRLGVPRPIRATVDRKGLGGKRKGVFTDGLEFQEVIEVYERPRRMGFSIAVDPRSLRENSTERHALEGGYFRFVDAAYTIQPEPDGRVRLVLSSTYAAKSSVNAYGELWATAIIGDFQDRVLSIIKRRCEIPPPKPSRPLAAQP
jgi:hypothetical protein